MAVTKEYIEKMFQQMNENIKKNKDEVIAMLQKNISALERKINERDERIMRLEENINYLENRSRISNIEIKNVPESKGEDLMTIVKRIGAAIGLDSIKEGDLQVIHRVNSKTLKPGQHRSIIVHLGSRYLRNKWIANFRKLRKEKGSLSADKISSRFSAGEIFIQEHVTVTTKRLLGEIKVFGKEKNIKYIWIKDGFILFKEKEEDRRVEKIGTRREFEDYKKKRLST